MSRNRRERALPNLVLARSLRSRLNPAGSWLALPVQRGGNAVHQPKRRGDFAAGEDDAFAVGVQAHAAVVVVGRDGTREHGEGAEFVRGEDEFFELPEGTFVTQDVEAAAVGAEAVGGASPLVKTVAYICRRNRRAAMQPTPHAAQGPSGVVLSFGLGGRGRSRES